VILCKELVPESFCGPAHPWRLAKNPDITHLPSDRDLECYRLIASIDYCNFACSALACFRTPRKGWFQPRQAASQSGLQSRAILADRIGDDPRCATYRQILCVAGPIHQLVRIENKRR